MVYKNLRKGLEKIGVEVEQYPVDLEKKSDHIVCLSDPRPYTLLGVDPSSLSLVGPNMWEIPIESVAEKYTDFLVPSQWVKDLYLTFDFMKGKNLHVWPVGIDTEEWKPAPAEEKVGDCLIYYKGINDPAAREIPPRLCLDKGLSFGSLSYGNYAETALLDATKKCKFAILMTKTESQGIAVQQILSSGLPCFVFEKEKWDDRDDGIECEATAVPYWDERCGVKVRQGASEQEIYEAFTYFLENIESFDPRSFIEENLTLESSAQKFVEILESTSDKKN